MVSQRVERQLHLVGVQLPPPEVTLQVRRDGPPDSFSTLAGWWPRIREGLMKIRERQGARATWRPEHVRAAIVGGQAELWGIFSNVDPYPEELAGFAVTQPLTDPFLNLPTGMFVWMAYQYTDVAGREKTVRTMDDHLTEVARSRGYTHLQAFTSRAGLGRRLRSMGWETVMHVVQKELY